MDGSSNPGSATPELLYKMYKDLGAASANPYLLRDLNNSSSAHHAACGGGGGGGGGLYAPTSAPTPAAMAMAVPVPARPPVMMAPHHHHRNNGHQSGGASVLAASTSSSGDVGDRHASADARCLTSYSQQRPLQHHRRSESPPRGHFRVVSGKKYHALGGVRHENLNAIAADIGASSRASGGGGVRRAHGAAQETNLRSQITLHSLDFRKPTTH